MFELVTILSFTILSLSLTKILNTNLKSLWGNKLSIALLCICFICQSVAVCGGFSHSVIESGLNLLWNHCSKYTDVKLWLKTDLFKEQNQICQSLNNSSILKQSSANLLLSKTKSQICGSLSENLNLVIQTFLLFSQFWVFFSDVWVSKSKFWDNLLKTEMIKLDFKIRVLHTVQPFPGFFYS